MALSEQKLYFWHWNNEWPAILHWGAAAALSLVAPLQLSGDWRECPGPDPGVTIARLSVLISSAISITLH